MWPDAHFTCMGRHANAACIPIMTAGAFPLHPPNGPMRPFKHLHSTHREIKVQRGLESCSGSQSTKWLRFKSMQSGSRTYLFTVAQHDFSLTQD